jgi:hypothetical protein
MGIRDSIPVGGVLEYGERVKDVLPEVRGGGAMKHGFDDVANRGGEGTSGIHEVAMGSEEDLCVFVLPGFTTKTHSDNLPGCIVWGDASKN